MGLNRNITPDIMPDVLRLLDRGLAVFPVDVATKRPAIEWGGFEAVMPTEEQAIKDFAYARTKLGDCAVGIACGPISNILLLDFDFKKHPEAQEFFDTHEFPYTWKERTGSGGIHIYFKWSDELNEKQTLTTSKLWPGVDTKGFGGYSKITPSPGYEWIVAPHMAPLASAPQWLIDLLPLKQKEGRVIGDLNKADDWMTQELENVQPGSGTAGRTPTFVRAIGRLKAKGHPEAEVCGILKPWAMKYEFPDLPALVADQYRRYPPRVQPVDPNMSEEESLSELLASNEIVDWIIPDMLQLRAIGFFAGLPEACKTWVLLDLAIELARGGLWLKKFPTKPCKILYIDQERDKGEMVRRVRALLKAKGINGDSISHNFTSRCATKTKIRLNNPESLKAFKKTLQDKQPDFVIVDSYKTFHTSNELSTHESQGIMQTLQELRDEFRCGFLFVHHETKGVIQKRKDGAKVSYLDASGTIDLPQTADTFFNVVARGECESMMYHTKLNGGIKRAPVLVKVVDLQPDKSEIEVQGY